MELSRMKSSTTNGNNRFKFHSYSQLYDSIHNYINWYNTERLHSSLGYLSPLEMEMKLKGIIKKAA